MTANFNWSKKKVGQASSLSRGSGNIGHERAQEAQEKDEFPMVGNGANEI